MICDMFTKRRPPRYSTRTSSRLFEKHDMIRHNTLNTTQNAPQERYMIGSVML